MRFATQLSCSFDTVTLSSHLGHSQHAKDACVTWSVGIILGKDSQLHTLVSLKALNLLFDAIFLQVRETVSDNRGPHAAHATLPLYPIQLAGARCTTTSPSVRKPATSMTVLNSFGKSSGLLTPSSRATAPTVVKRLAAAPPRARAKSLSLLPTKHNPLKARAAVVSPALCTLCCSDLRKSLAQTTTGRRCRMSYLAPPLQGLYAGKQLRCSKHVCCITLALRAAMLICLVNAHKQIHATLFVSSFSGPKTAHSGLCVVRPQQAVVRKLDPVEPHTLLPIANCACRTGLGPETHSQYELTTCLF